MSTTKSTEIRSGLTTRPLYVFTVKLPSGCASPMLAQPAIMPAATTTRTPRRASRRLRRQAPAFTASPHGRGGRRPGGPWPGGSHDAARVRSEAEIDPQPRPVHLAGRPAVAIGLVPVRHVVVEHREHQ